MHNFVVCNANIINDACRSINDGSKSIIDNSISMLQIVASLRTVIYKHKLFIIQAIVVLQCD
jgi:hypothetical protein